MLMTTTQIAKIGSQTRSACRRQSPLPLRRKRFLGNPVHQNVGEKLGVDSPRPATLEPNASELGFQDGRYFTVMYKWRLILNSFQFASCLSRFLIARDGIDGRSISSSEDERTVAISIMHRSRYHFAYQWSRFHRISSNHHGILAVICGLY